MLVNSIIESLRPAWREQIDRQLEPAGAEAPIASFNQLDDHINSEPPPAAPAIRPWPRVFPGL